MPKDTNKRQNTKKQEVKKDTKKQDSKNKKHFMKDFKAELKRVIWPTPKQLLNNTVAVITVVLITAAIVFVLDFVFESMNTYGIDKLKEVVDTTSENTTDINTTDYIELNATEETNTTADGNETTDENTVADESTNEVANETQDEATDGNSAE